MSAHERRVVSIHAVFTLMCVVGLLLPLPVGQRIALCVLAYHVLVVAWSRSAGDTELMKLWRYAAVLSVFQVVPDWFLSHVLGVLVFPEDGFPKIGTVSGYMAGLWTIPCIMIVSAARAIERRVSYTLVLEQISSPRVSRA